MSIFRFNITKELESIGFKKVPFFDIWVHPRNDKVYCCQSLTLGCWSIVSLSVHIPTDPTRYKTINHFTGSKPIHKLKALAFISLEKFKDLLGTDFQYDDLLKNKIIVNHKDGNKLNNDVDNLEWGFYVDNNNHAFKSGLRSDNYFGYCYDVIEERETPFYSISTLGKDINIHPDYISRYLKSERKTLLSHRYMVRRKDEAAYPVILNKCDVWRQSMHGIYPVLLVDNITKEKTEYAQFRDALKVIGKSYLSKKAIDLSNGIEVDNYSIYPINDYEKVMVLRKRYISGNTSLLAKNRQNKKPIPVVVTHLDGEEVQYNSLEILAKKYGVKKSRLKARILRYGGYWNDIHIRYLSPAKVKVLDPNLPELLENAQKSST